MLERLALAFIIGAIGGYVLARYLANREQLDDWQDDWTIEVPVEHLRDEALILQTLVGEE